jgi:hypothetical protein
MCSVTECCCYPFIAARSVAQAGRVSPER